MVDRCIAEPYAQSWSQSGMQIFQPQNLCSVTKGYEARNSAGSVDVTGKFSTGGGLRSRRQPFIGGGPDQQLPRLQPPQGHRQSDDGNRSSSDAMPSHRRNWRLGGGNGCLDVECSSIDITVNIELQRYLRSSHGRSGIH